MNKIKLITGLIATSICCMGNEMPAKAHHVNHYIDKHLANYCIQELSYATCTCLEADLLRGGNGRSCNMPATNQQPLFDPWENPFKDLTLQPPHISF